LSVSRSINEALKFLARASAQSSALAARISAARSRKVRAAATSARLFLSAGALATSRAAARAFAPTSRMAPRISVSGWKI
jgi:hypothetical protein